VVDLCFTIRFFTVLTAVLAKMGVTGINSNLATAICALMILIVAWGWYFFKNEQTGLATLNRQNLLFLMLSGFPPHFRGSFILRRCSLTRF
jgi:uncharacterized membrane protein